MKRVLVLGSISTDFVATTNIRPKAGETVQGEDFFTAFGGKGANQAVAAARMGAEVTMLGKIGDDEFATRLKENLTENSISVNHVESVTETPSGAALITIADKDNSIVYIPGANNKVDAKYIESKKDFIKDFDIAVVQNEVPKEALNKFVEICFDKKIPVVINPAPYREIDKDIIEKASYIIPNESEAELMFNNKNIDSVLREYPNKLLITMGSQGVKYFNGCEIKLVPAFKVEVVDTTGAGDTFVGAFSYARSMNIPLEKAIEIGNLASSISVGKFKAQGGMPKIEELKKNKNYNESMGL